MKGECRFMNESLIKQLYEERDNLYPNGTLIASRGNTKSYLWMVTWLKYTAYEIIADILETQIPNCSLEHAHELMEEWVDRILSGLRE